MSKSNRKAKNKSDMEIMLFGDILHPTHKAVRNARKLRLDLKRKEQYEINNTKFKKNIYHVGFKNKYHRRTSQERSAEQIKRGYDISKKWKDEYDETKKESIL